MGLDCYGLVLKAAEASGLLLPELPTYRARPDPWMALGAIRALSRESIGIPGDVVVWTAAGHPRHLGILVDEDREVSVIRDSTVKERRIMNAHHRTLWGYRSLV